MALKIRMKDNSLRFTGGEPFVRNDLIYFVEQLSMLQQAPEISVSTNATSMLLCCNPIFPI